MRYLSPNLLTAQHAASKTPYVTLVPGMGASVLSRDISATAAVANLSAIIVDSVDPKNLYVVGQTTTEGAGSNEMWTGKINSDDLDKNVAVVYGDANVNMLYAICQDDTYIYCLGTTSYTECVLIKYLKSDLSKIAAVDWTTATRGYGCTLYGDYVYIISRTSEGDAYPGGSPADTAGYIAELNKSDLSINADYYHDEAAGDGGYPFGWMYGITCDGANVFTVGTEYASGGPYQGAVDKYDVGGLANPTAKAISYGTAVWLQAVAHDETHLFAVGYDDKATDIGVIFKLLKSDLSMVAAASYTSADGACRLHDVVEDGDYIYVCGYSYFSTPETYNNGILLKLHKSDLSIESQQAYRKTTGPGHIVFSALAKDSSHIYTTTGTDVGYTIVKWNKGMLTTGTSGDYSVGTGNVTKATITPTIANSTRVLTASGDSVSANSLTAAASTAAMGTLRTIGATVLPAYNTTDRILGVIQTEIPYGGQCEIILDNADQTLSSLDFRGTQLNLAFGFTVSSVNYYSYVPVLYVYHQEDISYAGKLYTRLLCMDNWGKLEMHKIMGDVIAVVPSTGTDTVKEIIEKRKLSGMELIVDTSDGTEVTKVPAAKYEVLTDRKTIIQECNGLTQNLLRLRGGNMHMIKKDSSQQHRIVGTISGTFIEGETCTQAVTGATGKFVYQTSTYIVVEAQTGTFTESANTVTGGVSSATVANPSTVDAYDYLYGALAGDHPFYEHARTQAILEANRIIAVDVMPDTVQTLHTYPSSDTYYANDTDDQKAFGICTLIFEDPSISSDAEALAVANARLEHIKNEAQGGMLLAPMNCGQEMYDYVQIDDDRAGWTSGSEIANRVTKITRRYSPGEYTIELGFGGLEWEMPENFDLSVLVPEPKLLTEGRFPGPTPEYTPPQPSPAPAPGPAVPAGWPEAGKVDAPVWIGETAITREKYNEMAGGVAQRIYESLTPEQIEEYTESGRIRPTTPTPTPQWPRPRKQPVTGARGKGVKQGWFNTMLGWMRDWSKRR